MKYSSNKLLFVAIIVVGFSTLVFGQEPGDDSGRGDMPPPQAFQKQDGRQNTLRQLGLSREQAQQIRRINIGRKPAMDAAQDKLRDANRSLDEAIYADQLDEAVVNERLSQVQLAQSEVAKIRFMNEVAIRRVLTPEQLLKFRDLRERFSNVRERLDNARPMDRREPPVRRRPNSGDPQPNRPGGDLRKPIL